MFLIPMFFGRRMSTASGNPISADPRLPEELPPVQPPSAAFIAQLFLVPGLIVLAIVVVWLLITRMARTEQDWSSLVRDLGSPQEHLRWRGAFGLANLLQTDAGDPNQKGPPGSGSVDAPRLVTNRSIAESLSNLLAEELKSSSQKEDDLKHQAFLARTLGLMQVNDVVLPVLRKAVDPAYDREVRKNALGSLALIAGRELDARTPLQEPQLTEELVVVSAEQDILLRQLSAFVLGMLPGDASRKRLTVLLDDADENTRLNAAIGLARQESTAGIKVFRDVLENAEKPLEPSSNEEYTHFVRIKNALAGLQKITSHLTPAQREVLLPLVKKMADGYRESRLRIDAGNLLNALKSSGA